MEKKMSGGKGAEARRHAEEEHRKIEAALVQALEKRKVRAKGGAVGGRVPGGVGKRVGVRVRRCRGMRGRASVRVWCLCAR